MADFLFLMHGDSNESGDWPAYLAKLRQSGCFQGGSSIGGGMSVRKDGATPSTTSYLVGYIRVEARDLDHARTLLEGNPVFESGGTVEIRELPRD